MTLPTLQQLVAIMAADYTQPADIVADGLHARFTVLDDTLVLSFRGSEDREDWIDNLDLSSRVAYPLGALCAGFSDDVLGSYDQLRVAASERAKRLFAIIGHSRGGAQAQVAAGRFAADCIPVDWLVTCGAPGVCGSGLSRWIGAIGGPDLVNGNDPVPALPPDWRPPRTHKLIGAKRTLPIRVSDHYIAAYEATVDALAPA